MTEAEWNVCTDPRPMLESLGGKTSQRKLRLFAVSCCRARWADLFPAETAHQAVEIAERYADGHADLHELRVADGRTVAAMPHAARGVCCEDPSIAAVLATNCGERDRAFQTLLLREIFGNPFRIVGVDAHHITLPVKSVGQAIYRDRTFDRLPILADVLEDAGCTDPDILAHCRGPGPHVRGCWVVDLLTGRR